MPLIAISGIADDKPSTALAVVPAVGWIVLMGTVFWILGSLGPDKTHATLRLQRWEGRR